MSFSCPFGCPEERSGQKIAPHILKDHRQALLAAILPSGTLYSCLKQKGEGEPELCVCFGCKVSWKNKTVASRHFNDEEGKKCLIKHKAFLLELQKDSEFAVSEKMLTELADLRKELRSTKSKLYDAQMEIAKMKEDSDPQGKEVRVENQHLRQYIQNFGDLVFNVMRNLMTEEQHKKLNELDSLNCKEAVLGDEKSKLRDKLQEAYHTDDLVKLRWFPDADTFLIMKKTAGVCYTDYLPWTRISVLRTFWPKFY
jgi:hypothetical protein